MKLDIDYKAIGLRIKAARARKGLTQGNIAGLTGLSTPHISNIETGNTKLGLPTIIHLANVLDVSVDELLCDNIHRSEQIYCNELSDLLKGCSVDELHIISELAKVIKKSGINSAKKTRKRRTKAEMAAAKAAESEAAQKP
ncbi:helix-turn-helix transcriptional regulator [uncultured Phascolarctobacterium sp.]|mgnify:FL=1|uniref:helix-turn-helix domain-containing protein n=1 Tax=uncultured Phascolarctobacterium sp. TaxID=512296 RepID=UPI0025DD4FC7|nr:helix-turn-helix transcriptional regulator [uncultured Phascolarctobacterium sp.]